MVLDGDVAIDLSNLLVWCIELKEFADEKADDLSGWITESEVYVGIADSRCTGSCRCGSQNTYL